MHRMKIADTALIKLMPNAYTISFIYHAEGPYEGYSFWNSGAYKVFCQMLEQYNL